MALRRNSTRTSRILACVAAFAAAAVAVYVLGKQAAPAPEPRFVSRATITCTLPSTETAGQVSWPTGLDEATVAQQILSDESLRSIADPAGTASAQSLQEVRRSLQVSIRDPGTSGSLAIDITCQGTDADWAVELVNRLAEQYCRRERARLEQPARNVYINARNVATAAHDRWVTAQSRLDAALEERFQTLSAESQRLAAATVQSGAPSSSASQFEPPRTVPVPITGPPRHPVDNPEWLDLNAQIIKLKDSRSQLLAGRTSLHPDVQAVEQQIADLQAQLAATPRMIDPREIRLPLAGEPVPDGSRIPPLPPDEDQINNQPVEPTPLGAEQTAPEALAMVEAVEAAAKDFRHQREAVRVAREQYDKLAADARLAWAAQFGVPTFAVQPGAASEAAVAGKKPADLPLVALVAGLAAALSTAMLMPGAGYSIFTDAGQVEQHLQVPVLGKVAGTSPAASPTASRSQSSASGNFFQVFLVTLLLAGLAAAAAGYYFGW